MFRLGTIAVLALVAFSAPAAAQNAPARNVPEVLGLYGQALAANDASKACRFLSAQARRKIGGVSCARTVHKELDRLGSRRRAFARVRNRNVLVAGSRARVWQFYPAASGIPFQRTVLVVEDGEWRIEARGTREPDPPAPPAGVETLDRRSAARAISANIEEQGLPTPRRVVCPSGILALPRQRFTCVLRVLDADLILAQATLVDDQGRFNFDLSE